MDANLPIGNLRPGVNLHAREVQIDPFPTYEALRKYSPVCQVEPDGIWAVSRYDDVQYALKHPELFSSAAFKELYEPEWLREDCRRGYFILSEDPPIHTKHRAIVNKAFIHRVIDGLVPRMRIAAQNLLQDIGPGRTVKFIEEFSDPYVAKIMGHITGTDSSDAGEIRRLIELTQVITPHKPSDDHIHALEEITLEQRDRFTHAINSRRTCPQQDLVSEVISAEVDGEKLDAEMLIHLLDLLVHAGFHTGTNALAHCIIQLARGPELFSLLRRKRDLIPSFVEEVLRFEPPSHNLLRKTTSDVTLSGVTIPAESLVFLLLASANRDEARFESPAEFNIGRRNIKEHIAFGSGPHVCIGSALARLELKIALEEIVTKFESVSCPPDEDLPWAGALLVHAVTELEVSFS